MEVGKGGEKPAEGLKYSDQKGGQRASDVLKQNRQCFTKERAVLCIRCCKWAMEDQDWKLTLGLDNVRSPKTFKEAVSVGLG